MTTETRVNLGDLCCVFARTHSASVQIAIVVNKPVAKRSTSFHGEVEAVNLALKFVYDNPHLQFNVVLIHTDCRAAMDAIINNTGKLTRLQNDITMYSRALNCRGIDIALCWIPGNAGIVANELADNSAKLAAEETKAWTHEQNTCDVTVSCAKNQLKLDLVAAWQRQWDIQTDGRWTHGLLPKVRLHRGKELLHDRPLRQADCRLNRLLSGCTLLKTHPLRQMLDRKAGIPVSIRDSSSWEILVKFVHVTKQHVGVI